MWALRTILHLCLGLVLWCGVLSWPSPGRPLASIIPAPKAVPPPLPPTAPSQMQNGTAILVQSIFEVPPTCQEGFALTGNPQRCRKRA